MIQFSKHSEIRSAQRNISAEEINYVVKHGQKFHKSGAKIYFLRNCDIPDWDRRNDRRTRLAGTAVVLSKNERFLITVWRNRNSGLKRIKRKPKYDVYPKKQDDFLSKITQHY